MQTVVTNVTATNMHSKFQKNLYSLRKAKDVNLDEAAKGMNISRATLGFYEAGTRRPDITTLKKIADYYEVSCAYLLGESPTPDINLDLENAMAYTGLSKEAVECLIALKNNDNNLTMEEAGFERLKGYMWTVEMLLKENTLLGLLMFYLNSIVTHFSVADSSGIGGGYLADIKTLLLYNGRTGLAYQMGDISEVYLVDIIGHLQRLRRENLGISYTQPEIVIGTPPAETN
jgi:transcriptional regulator with XRE-family HTH domain